VPRTRVCTTQRANPQATGDLSHASRRPPRAYQTKPTGYEVPGRFRLPSRGENLCAEDSGLHDPAGKPARNSLASHVPGRSSPQANSQATGSRRLPVAAVTPRTYWPRAVPRLRFPYPPIAPIAGSISSFIPPHPPSLIGVSHILR